MSHNNGGVTNLGEKSILEFEKSLPYDDEGGMGDLNCTPYWVKPLVSVSLSFEFHVTFMMNVKP
jgi:hypothetical protein